MSGLIKRDKHGLYILQATIYQISKRYGKRHITVRAGFKSNGASGPARDIFSEAWWVHDWICSVWCFDDGTPITTHMASTILADILLAEGHLIIAYPWWVAVRAFGPRSPHG